MAVAVWLDFGDDCAGISLERNGVTFREERKGENKRGHFEGELFCWQRRKKRPLNSLFKRLLLKEERKDLSMPDFWLSFRSGEKWFTVAWSVSVDWVGFIFEKIHKKEKWKREEKKRDCWWIWRSVGFGKSLELSEVQKRQERWWKPTRDKKKSSKTSKTRK